MAKLGKIIETAKYYRGKLHFLPELVKKTLKSFVLRK